MLAVNLDVEFVSHSCPPLAILRTEQTPNKSNPHGAVAQCVGELEAIADCQERPMRAGGSAASGGKVLALAHEAV